MALNLAFIGQLATALIRFFTNLILRFAIARHNLSLALSILEAQGIEGDEAIAVLRVYGGMANG